MPGGEFNFGIGIGVDVPPRPVPFMFGPIPCYFRGHIDIGMSFNLVVIGWAEPGEPLLDGHLVLDPFPYAEAAVGAGVADVAAIEGYLGGGAHIVLNYPYTPPEPVLEELKIYLKGGVRLVVWIFTYEWPILEYTWDVYGGYRAVAPREPIFGVMPRDYVLDRRGYAVFVANDRRYSGGRSVITNERPIETNVFSQSTPDLAAIGDDLLGIWIYDDYPARTPLNRTQVRFARAVPTVDPADPWLWDVPAAVSDDGTADFHPQLAPLAGGDALLAWENVDDVLIELGEPNEPCGEYCEGSSDPNCPVECKYRELRDKTEIAVARYDNAAGTWSALQILTDNTWLDRSPRLATTADDTAVLTWISNTASDAFGSSALPKTLRYAAYDGVDWSAPADLATDVGAVIKTALAYSGSEAILLFVGDLDDEPNTPNDRELFCVIYDGATWGPITQLTSDNIEDGNPQVQYDSTGNPLLVWYRGGEIVMATDPLLPEIATVVDLQLEASSGMADFRLATGADDQIALVWQDATSDEMVDMWTAIYDPNLELWSYPHRLTNDDHMEHAMAPTFASSGDLVALYDKVDIIYMPDTIDVSGEQVDIERPVADFTSLYQINHRVTGDLAVQDADISITPANPTPGQLATVSVRIHNLGDVAANNVAVAFYDGHPDDDVLIDIVTHAGLLYGGTSAMVTAEWLVPESVESRNIYVYVDPPRYQQEDGNRDNNLAALHGIMGPDLTVASLNVQAVGDARSFDIRVANLAGLTVNDVQLKLRRDTLAGPLLATLTIDDPIEPGTYVDVSWLWAEPPACVISTPVYAIVDEADMVAEFDETNNTRMTVVSLSAPFVEYDLNYDGIVSIIGDIPPFVACVYFDDCECPEPGCLCPADCSGDGFLSIIGDVPCFVACVYFDDCGRATAGAGAHATGDRATLGVTIGGAVFTDLYDPLGSGLTGVTLDLVALRPTSVSGSMPKPPKPGAPGGDQGAVFATITSGQYGLWQFDDVPPGMYEIRPHMAGSAFEHVASGVPDGQPTVHVTVTTEVRAQSQSIQFLVTETDK